MENTIENKAKFFAQYWMQSVLRYHIAGVPTSVDENVLDLSRNNLKHAWLELTPPSKITDEHAIEVANMLYTALSTGKIARNEKAIISFGVDGDFLRLHETFYEVILECKRETRKTKNNYPVEVIDFLRSKGYYLGNVIEIEHGWIKLKTK